VIDLKKEGEAREKKLARLEKTISSEQPNRRATNDYQ